MGHEGTGGVAESRDQLHYVLSQEVNLVVLLVRRTLRLTVAPGRTEREEEGKRKDIQRREEKLQ